MKVERTLLTISALMLALSGTGALAQAQDRAGRDDGRVRRGSPERRANRDGDARSAGRAIPREAARPAPPAGRDEWRHDARRDRDDGYRAAPPRSVPPRTSPPGDARSPDGARRYMPRDGWARDRSPGYAPRGYAPPRYTPPRYAPPRYAPPRYAPPRYAPPRYGAPRVIVPAPRVIRPPRHYYGPGGHLNAYFGWGNGYRFGSPYTGRVYGYVPPGAYGMRRFYGDVRLQVRPRHAQVYVDGYYAGIVDSFDGVFQRLTLEVGEHEIEIAAPGYEPQFYRIYVDPSRTVDVHGDLYPAAAGGYPGDYPPY